MKNIKGIVAKLSGLMAACALVMGVASSQVACAMVFHQPKVPQGMNKFTRKK